MNGFKYSSQDCFKMTEKRLGQQCRYRHLLLVGLPVENTFLIFAHAKWSKMAQNDDFWWTTAHTKCSKWFKMTTSTFDGRFCPCKMLKNGLQNGKKWPKMTIFDGLHPIQNVPKWSKMTTSTFDGLFCPCKMVKNGPKWRFVMDYWPFKIVRHGPKWRHLMDYIARAK